MMAGVRRTPSSSHRASTARNLLSESAQGSPRVTQTSWLPGTKLTSAKARLHSCNVSLRIEKRDDTSPAKMRPSRRKSVLEHIRFNQSRFSPWSVCTSERAQSRGGGSGPASGGGGGGRSTGASARHFADAQPFNGASTSRRATPSWNADSPQVSTVPFGSSPMTSDANEGPARTSAALFFTISITSSVGHRAPPDRPREPSWPRCCHSTKSGRVLFFPDRAPSRRTPSHHLRPY
mmetsp:Transcript_13858/g.39796  ORF Transcript_13858/g.39796 Transcript_13858/m.39796 type:complete len:235 (+) Transcript_13858:776-1480(+)